MLTVEQITEAFTAFLEADFHNPEVYNVQITGEEDGFTKAQMVFSRNTLNPAQVTRMQYKFRWDELDNRVVIYFH